MRKRFVCAIMAVLLCVCLLPLSACDSNNLSTNVSSTASSIMSSYAENGYIVMHIDTDKVRDTSISEDKDKSYVFPSVYEYFLTMSSGLFFNYFVRNDSGSSCFNMFSKEQNKGLLDRLLAVKDALSSLNREKNIYEDSNGYLRYKEVVHFYNLAIDSLYDLNSYFAEIYFKAIGFNPNAVTDLSQLGSKLNDYLWHLVSIASRVPFGYEVSNYVYSNPFGDMTAWYNKSVYTKEVISTCTPIISRLKSAENISSVLSSASSNDLINLVKSIYAGEDILLRGYNAFVTAKSGIDLPTFLSLNSDSDVELYLSRISSLDRSRFNVVFSYLNGGYSALITAMGRVADDVVS